MKILNDIVLRDILPDSIKNDSVVRDSAAAIDPELKKIAAATNLAAVFASIDQLTSLQLDHLAAGFDVTTWRDTWSIDVKRRVAKVLATQKTEWEPYRRSKKFYLRWALRSESLNGGRRIRKAPHTHLNS